MKPDPKIARLLHPGQRCGNCRHILRYVPGRGSFFTGECGAITDNSGKPNGSPVVDGAGFGCLFWRVSGRKGEGR